MAQKPVMDGYIRVSQVAGRAGERFQSPSQQRDAITGWALANGVHIGAWHEDLDRSGGTMDRPGMNEVLRRVQAGLTGGVVVARLDRFARTLLGGLTTIRDLDAGGARVVSVAEQIDPATPVGRAMLGLLLIMAEWQRDQADEHLAVAIHRAATAGRFPGRAAFGYQRTPDGQTIIDPEAAKVVQRIFQARAAGAGWRKIADDLTRDNVVTPGGRGRWAPSTLARIIHSEAVLGVFVGPRGLRIEQAWPAIITRELWDHANEQRGVRDDARRYQDRLLAGIARCAECRRVLARTVNPHGFVSYACRTVACHRRPSVGAALLDEHAASLVDQRLAGMVLQPRTIDSGEGERLTIRRDRATTELEAWRDDLEARGVLGDTDYRAGLLARARARDDAEADLAGWRARSGVLDELPDGVVPSLAGLPWEGQRRVVERMLHSVWLRPSDVRGPGARRHVARRVLVVWRDDPRLPVLPSPSTAAPGPLEW